MVIDGLHAYYKYQSGTKPRTDPFWGSTTEQITSGARYYFFFVRFRNGINHNNNTFPSSLLLRVRKLFVSGHKKIQSEKLRFGLGTTFSSSIFCLEASGEHWRVLATHWSKTKKYELGRKCVFKTNFSLASSYIEVCGPYVFHINGRVDQSEVILLGLPPPPPQCMSIKRNVLIPFWVDEAVSVFTFFHTKNAYCYHKQYAIRRLST